MNFCLIFEKGDFVKVELPPRREHDFQGFELSKIHKKIDQTSLHLEYENKGCENYITNGFGKVWSSFFADLGWFLGWISTFWRDLRVF